MSGERDLGADRQGHVGSNREAVVCLNGELRKRNYIISSHWRITTGRLITISGVGVVKPLLFVVHCVQLSSRKHARGTRNGRTEGMLK